jgi:hypothetical protein
MADKIALSEPVLSVVERVEGPVVSERQRVERVKRSRLSTLPHRPITCYHLSLSKAALFRTL